MHVYHCLDIKQPDAVPSYGRSLAVGNPVEFIEDMCQVFFFYSDAVVGNADDDRTVALSAVIWMCGLSPEYLMALSRMLLKML